VLAQIALALATWPYNGRDANQVVVHRVGDKHANTFVSNKVNWQCVLVMSGLIQADNVVAWQVLVALMAWLHRHMVE